MIALCHDRHGVCDLRGHVSSASSSSSSSTAARQRESARRTSRPPNRKPYFDDEVLEGKRLERYQFVAVLLLAVLVIALPLYWVLEPDRQAGAKEHAQSRFVTWGSQLFETTANHGFNCAGCHGGMTATGGNAPYAVTDPQTGQVKAVSWYAPALNTVLYRFSDAEVIYILTYGRVGSPMSAWGTDGGGPMNSQQLQTLVAYLRSIQIPRRTACPARRTTPTCASGHLPAADQANIQKAASSMPRSCRRRRQVHDRLAALGEACSTSTSSSGAYSCARCHTQGWSYNSPGASGIGAYGWNLTGGAVNAHFDNEENMIEAIKTGSDLGKRFGRADRSGHRADARIRPTPHRRPDQGHRRIRPESVMNAAMLAINWFPEIKGILIVTVAVVVFMGSIYLILATNMGARLGFLVALAAIAGWFFLMGCVWWTYGKGFLGPAASWKPVANVSVLQDTDRAVRRQRSERVASRRPPGPRSRWPTRSPSTSSTRAGTSCCRRSRRTSRPARRRRPCWRRPGAFDAGEFQVVNVFEKGGERSPTFFGGSVDFLAFWHKPHYALVEVAPLVPQRARTRTSAGQGGDRPHSAAPVRVHDP